MINNKSGLKVKIGERLYEFLCDHDAPVGEVHDAISKMKAFVVDIINSNHKKEEELNNKSEQKPE